MEDGSSGDGSLVTADSALDERTTLEMIPEVVFAIRTDETIGPTQLCERSQTIFLSPEAILEL
jgi:hypothetical protein